MRIVRLILIYVFLWPLAVPVTLAQEKKPGLVKRRLEPFINKVMSLSNTSGLAVIIVQNGEVTYMKGFGVKDKRTGEPITTKPWSNVEPRRLLLKTGPVKWSFNPLEIM